MATLYELSKDFTDLFNRYETLSEEADGDIELYEELQEAWFDTLDGIEGEIEAKAEAIACYIKQLNAEAEALKAEKQRLATRQSAKENAARRMRDYLLEMMVKVNRNKIETAKAKITVTKGRESIAVANESYLIERLKRSDPYGILVLTPSISKAAAKRALLDGAEIDGVSLEREPSLMIK